MMAKHVKECVGFYVVCFQRGDEIRFHHNLFLLTWPRGSMFSGKKMGPRTDPRGDPTGNHGYLGPCTTSTNASCSVSEVRLKLLEGSVRKSSDVMELTVEYRIYILTGLHTEKRYLREVMKG